MASPVRIDRTPDPPTASYLAGGGSGDAPVGEGVAPRAARPKVLLVDDERAIVEGLGLHLRRDYEVFVAGGGVDGLVVLAQQPDIAVVVSDMRMPGMDGATFLAAVRKAQPETTRVLLTGHADLEAAISAVNDSQIFRFLTKPCPPDQLRKAIAAAAEQHNLVRAERVLLEQTLRGSIKALVDVLALVNPTAFGRASRVTSYAAAVARRLQFPRPWQVEMAAMLAPLGTVSLPHDTCERLYEGAELGEAEQTMVARVPLVSEHLIASIPRLEAVRAILKAAARGRHVPAEHSPPELVDVEHAADILRAAMDLDSLEHRGMATPHALQMMREHTLRYSAAIVDALDAERSAAGLRDEMRELPLSALRPGMVLVEDLRLSSGALLVGKGYTLTEGFIARVRNMAPSAVKPTLRVIVPGHHDSHTLAPLAK